MWFSEYITYLYLGMLKGYFNLDSAVFYYLFTS